MILPADTHVNSDEVVHDVKDKAIVLIILGVYIQHASSDFTSSRAGKTSPHSLTFGRDPGGYASSDRSREFAPSLFGFVQPAKSGISGLGLFKKSLSR
jgi:hypothetical protein